MSALQRLQRVCQLRVPGRLGGAALQCGGLQLQQPGQMCQAWGLCLQTRLAGSDLPQVQPQTTFLLEFYEISKKRKEL